MHIQRSSYRHGHLSLVLHVTPAQLQINNFLAHERDQARFERLRLHLGLYNSLPSASKSGMVVAAQEPTDIDLEQLRKDCWMGIPHKLRPTVWRLLSVGL